MVAGCFECDPLGTEFAVFYNRVPIVKKCLHTNGFGLSNTHIEGSLAVKGF